MTVRNWTRVTYTGTSQVGGNPSVAVAYTQNGLNATKAERLAGIYKDHPYNMTKNTTVTSASMTQDYRGGPIQKCATSWFSAYATFDSPPQPDLAKAVNKLLEKWRGSSFDAGVSIGEGKESVEMIIQRLRSLASSANALRKGNFGGALAALAHVNRGDRRNALKAMNSKYFSQAWLELQYGWKPLLNDIYAASEFVKTKPTVGVIRTSVKETADIQSTNPSVYPKDHIALIVNERRRHLKVTVVNRPSTFERLGLTDPLTIAWELVPFSFVVDWVVPIGEVIQAMHAVNAMQVISCCDTSVWNRLANLCVQSGHRYGNAVCRQSAVTRLDVITMSRTVYPSLPPAWSILANAVARQFSVPLSSTWSQAVSAGALARTNLNRLR
jgi:hypothetical protein